MTDFIPKYRPLMAASLESAIRIFNNVRSGPLSVAKQPIGINCATGIREH
jgi:hypothetical protein